MCSGGEGAGVCKLLLSVTGLRLLSREDISPALPLAKLTGRAGTDGHRQISQTKKDRWWVPQECSETVKGKVTGGTPTGSRVSVHIRVHTEAEAPAGKGVAMESL